MQRLLIVGAGGFGREVLQWARDVEATQSQWKIGGFLDANADALSGFDIDMPILGDPATFIPAKTDVCVCAIGDPGIKQRVVTGLMRSDAKFVTLLHPSVTIGRNCCIGEGSVLCPGVVLTTNVKLGRFVTVNLASTFGHDASAGDWCSLMVHTDIAGDVYLGEGVLAGSHAFVLPGMRVGEHAIVGAGSVVVRDVLARATVFGVPAKQICVSDPKDTRFQHGGAK